MDIEVARQALARMIIIDELPFSFVEGEGFKKFLVVVCPWFYAPSRVTVRADCMKLYLSEQSRLKNILKMSCQRVSITMDTWTSVQRINYMCVTTHFIDEDWKLNKKILIFCPITSHRGENIGIAIEKCLKDYGMDKVMCVTMDNASSNDLTIGYLRDRSSLRSTNLMKGKYLKMRCVTHIISLVVVDGVKLVGESIEKIRAATRYIRMSLSRLEKFKKCVIEEKIESKALLCLDVPTWWNSTYKMLDTALKLRDAFDRYDLTYTSYRIDLEVDGKGRPSYGDWENVKLIVKFLERFYELTLLVFGSLYVTSNIYFKEISEIYCLLKDAMAEGDEQFDLVDMATKMKEKTDKYWGNGKNLNLLIHIATILDPRQKWEFMDPALGVMYKEEDDLRMEMKARVKDAFEKLFEEYIKMCMATKNSKSQEDYNDVVEVASQKKGRLDLFSLQKKKKVESESGKSKSELDKYMGEPTKEDSKQFDLLQWWRVSSERFPILSRIVRDVLAVPISTVALEFTFSTGGRVLDNFRSYLTPSIVEALMCCQDWFHSPSTHVNSKEDLQDLEKIEDYGGHQVEEVGL